MYVCLCVRSNRCVCVLFVICCVMLYGMVVSLLYAGGRLCVFVVLSVCFVCKLLCDSVRFRVGVFLWLWIVVCVMLVNV